MPPVQSLCCLMQAFQYSFLAYRYEERKGADAKATDADDPNEMKASSLMTIDADRSRVLCNKFDQPSESEVVLVITTSACLTKVSSPR